MSHTALPSSLRKASSYKLSALTSGTKIPADKSLAAADWPTCWPAPSCLHLPARSCLADLQAKVGGQELIGTLDGWCQLHAGAQPALIAPGSLQVEDTAEEHIRQARGLGAWGLVSAGLPAAWHATR